MYQAAGTARYIWRSSRRLLNGRAHRSEPDGEKGLAYVTKKIGTEAMRYALWAESQNQPPLSRAADSPNQANAGVREGGSAGARSEGGTPRPLATREADHVLDLGLEQNLPVHSMNYGNRDARFQSCWQMSLHWHYLHDKAIPVLCLRKCMASRSDQPLVRHHISNFQSPKSRFH